MYLANREVISNLVNVTKIKLNLRHRLVTVAIINVVPFDTDVCTGVFLN